MLGLMVKKFGASVSNYVWDEYIEKRPTGISRSEWIETLILRGGETLKKGLSTPPKNGLEAYQGILTGTLLLPSVDLSAFALGPKNGLHEASAGVLA